VPTERELKATEKRPPIRPQPNGKAKDIAKAFAKKFPGVLEAMGEIE
jgi:hypothetical protein